MIFNWFQEGLILFKDKYIYQSISIKLIPPQTTLKKRILVDYTLINKL